MQRPDVFDPTKRYVIKNPFDFEFKYKYANPDFTFAPNPAYSTQENKRLYDELYKKNGYKEIVLQKGEMIEVPEWLAFRLTKHMVDKAYVENVEKMHGPLSRRKRNSNEANEAAEGEILLMSTSGARDELETMVMQPIREGQESPVVTSMREKLRAEIEAEVRADERAKLASEQISEVKEEANEEEKPRRGRPRKEFADAKVEAE